MRTYGEPPEYFKLKDYEIVDNICELIRDKYRGSLAEPLTPKEKMYLEIFTPELLKSSRY